MKNSHLDGTVIDGKVIDTTVIDTTVIESDGLLEFFMHIRVVPNYTN